jgi:hypothetical protein
MIKKLLLMILLFVGIFSMDAQTEEELKSQKSEKEAAAKALQSEADAIQGQIDALPGWRLGAFGTLGASVSGFNNWFGQENPNVSAGNIGITLNGFANFKQEKYFWKNALNINLGWVKFDDKDDPTDTDEFREATDVFNISSLYGRNIFKNLAASVLLEYRSTLLSNLNDPGYLDIGVGVTWTPIENLIVVIHPLNYNFVFADNDAIFQSSLGAKILVDYTRKFGALELKSNLSAFQSYEYARLSNWTWINSLGYTVWKGIGVGFEFGLRGNEQEAVNFATTNFVEGSGPAPSFDNVENELQSFWLFGLNYSF